MRKSVNFFLPRRSVLKPLENRRDSLYVIPNEDMIFENEKFRRSVVFTNKIQLNKKEVNKDKYSINSEILKKIKEAQKQKHLELGQYQKNLVKSINGAIRNESLKSLELKLLAIRVKFNKVKTVESMDSLYQIIKKEDKTSIITLRKSYDNLVKYKDKLKRKGIIDFNF